MHHHFIKKIKRSDCFAYTKQHFQSIVISHISIEKFQEKFENNIHEKSDSLLGMNVVI